MAIPSPFFWGKGGKKMTPEQVEQQRALAALAQNRAGDTSPVGHWTQGAARVVDALGAGLRQSRADKAETAGMAEADAYVQGNPVLASLVGGGGYTGVEPRVMETSAAFGDAPMNFAGISNAEKLRGVDPRLGEVISEAARRAGLRVGVSEGLRDAERQRQMVAEGKSKTMNSKHLHGGAGDFHIIGDDGKPIWDFEAYRPLADEAKRVAAELGYNGFEWGGDWNTLKDGVHFQFSGGGGAAPIGQQSQPGPNVVSALAQSLSNPWVAKKYGPVIQALMGNEMKRADMQYQQQLRQQDPLYQAQLANMTAPNPVDPWAGTQVINGQVVRMGETGPEVIGDFSDPEQPEFETQRIKMPDGSEVMVERQKGTNDPWQASQIPQGGTTGSGAPVKKLTESQAKTTLFSRMQEETAPVISQIEEIWNPANMSDAVARSTPIAGNFFQSEQGQIYQSAAAAWAEGALRVSTGAAATQPEIERNMKTYFAQPGDTPSVVAFKREMREMYNRAIRESLGEDLGQPSLMLPDEFAQKYMAIQKGETVEPTSADDYAAFANDPNVQQQAEKYGVTVEEMWAIKQGLK